MGDTVRWRPHVCALLGYAAIAIVFTWPLAPNLGTHLTGSPAGDTGVYARQQALIEAGAAFAQRANVAFVIDLPRAPEPLRDFAVRAFRLQLIEADGIFALYRPS